MKPNSLEVEEFINNLGIDIDSSCTVYGKKACGRVDKTEFRWLCFVFGDMTNAYDHYLPWSHQAKNIDCLEIKIT